MLNKNVPASATTTKSNRSIQPQGTRISSGRTAAGGNGIWGSVRGAACGGWSVCSGAGAGGRERTSEDSTGCSGGGLFSSLFMIVGDGVPKAAGSSCAQLERRGIGGRVGNVRVRTVQSTGQYLASVRFFVARYMFGSALSNDASAFLPAL